MTFLDGLKFGAGYYLGRRIMKAIDYAICNSNEVKSFVDKNLGANKHRAVEETKRKMPIGFKTD